MSQVPSVGGLDVGEVTVGVEGESEEDWEPESRTREERGSRKSGMTSSGIDRGR